MNWILRKIGSPRYVETHTDAHKLLKQNWKSQEKIIQTSLFETILVNEWLAHGGGGGGVGVGGCGRDGGGGGGGGVFSI